MPWPVRPGRGELRSGKPGDFGPRIDPGRGPEELSPLGLKAALPPTAGLDPAAGQEAIAALARGTTLVVATHDVDLALAWADRVAVLVGSLVRQGPPEKLLGDDTLLTPARLRRPRVLSVAARLRARGVLGQETPVRDEPSLPAALG
ncbi:hypothetical protein GCM10022223_50190 [Kineosporia mesophila]|uniref:Uncharacterized protein n=1 Tax=Kineosporia mesophila TaxID=566012 RepID=A0ABP7A830_9ACTN